MRKVTQLCFGLVLLSFSLFGKGDQVTNHSSDSRKCSVVQNHFYGYVGKKITMTLLKSLEKKLDKCVKETKLKISNHWVKLNGRSTVCFQGRRNQPGSFTPDVTGFLAAVKLVHRRGKIRCGAVGAGGAKHNSNWGCNVWGGLKKHSLNIFVTNRENKVIFPLTGHNLIGNAAKWYGIDGFNSISTSLVLQRGFNDPYYISRDSTLRVWYGEDLFNKWESDNVGRVCADVYGHFI